MSLATIPGLPALSKPFRRGGIASLRLLQPKFSRRPPHHRNLFQTLSLRPFRLSLARRRTNWSFVMTTILAAPENLTFLSLTALIPPLLRHRMGCLIQTTQIPLIH